MAKLKPTTISIVILFAVVLGGLGYVLGSIITSAQASKPQTTQQGPGAVYETPVPVADFTLADQTGKKFTFSSTRGKVVLMTFLFTHCGDVCPFSAVKMRLALEQLGVQANQVELVVVDTDPERDTVPVVADYSKALGLYELWHMVTGPVADMQKLYKDLKVTVLKTDDEEVMETTKNATELGITLPSKDKTDSPLYGLTDEQIAIGGKVAKQFSGGYQIAHSAPFWVIDADGRIRTSLDVSASPAQIAEAIRAYLKKS